MLFRNSLKGGKGNPPKPQESQTRRFRLVRYFTVISLIMLIPAALALTYFLEMRRNLFLEHSQKERKYFQEMQTSLFKQQEDAARRDLLATNEAGSVNLAHLLENVLWEKDFAPFVVAAQKIPVEACRAMADVKDEKNGTMKPSEEKQACFSELGKKFMRIAGFADLNAKVYAAMKQSTVFKIKVFDLRGITLYSSEHRQIGEDKASNVGWIGATREGKRMSELTYRDKFTAFEGVVEKRDLIAIYLPALQPGSKRIVGVFEIYSDVTPLLEQIKKTSADIKKTFAANMVMTEQINAAMHVKMNKWENQTLPIVLVFVLALFGALLMIVRRADGIITKQDNEREKTGKTLHDSETMSRAITESIVEGVITTTTENIVLEANKAALRLFGYEKSELIGRDVSELVPERHRRQYRDTTAALAAQPEAFNIPGREVRSLRKDGSEFSASMSFADVQVGGRRLFTGMILDITERKRFTEALRASEAQLRQITDAVPALIAYLDLEQRFHFHNKAYEDVFGLSFEQINGHTLAEVLGQPTYESVQDKVEEVLRGFPVRYERVHITPQGDLRNYVTQYFPRFGEGADEVKVVGFYTLGTDITERRRIDRMKIEFLSTVSHELRTPLTSISGSLELIAVGVAGELSEDMKTLVGIAKNNCERLIRLVNDILDSEKIMSGQMRLNLQVVDIRPLLWQALAANQGFADQYRVTTLLQVPDEPLQVHIDSDRLTQVLINLLSNACKFSSPEGAVEVRVSRVGKQVRVEVADHGVGIPEEFKSRIFQKFSQADSSDTKQKGGTGLGLNIAKALVDKMGGQIGFDSEAGAGATFFVELPEWKEPAEFLGSDTNFAAVRSTAPEGSAN